MGAAQAQNVKLPVVQAASRTVDFDHADLDATTGVLIATLPAGELRRVATEILATTFDGSAVLTVGTTTTTDLYQDSGDITEGTAGWYTEVVSGQVPKTVTAGTEVRLFLASGSPTQGQARVSVDFIAHDTTDPS